MKLFRTLIVCVPLALALCVVAAAQVPPATSGGSKPAAAPGGILAHPDLFGTTSTAAPVVVVHPAGGATISGGSLIGDILMWASLLVGTPLAGIIGLWIAKIFQRLGVDMTDAQRKRLLEIVENGLALAAQRARTNLAGTMTLEVRNQVAVDALAYVQDHGAETIKALGLDPTEAKATEAIQARIAKAMNDKLPAPPPAQPAGAPA